MVKEIVGFQRVEYDKKDGSGHVSGVNLFIAAPIPTDRGSGMAVDKVYVSSKKIPENFGVGTYDIEYDIDYQGKGYISKITAV